MAPFSWELLSSQLCCAGLLGLGLCGYLHLCILGHRHDLNSPGGTVGGVLSPSDIVHGKAAVSQSSPSSSSCDLAGTSLPALPHSKERVTCWEGVGAHCTSALILPYFGRSYWDVFINKLIISFLILLVCLWKSSFLQYQLITVDRIWVNNIAPHWEHVLSS